MWFMAEGEPRNPIADELLSRVAIDTQASRQAVAGGAGMFLVDPDRAQQFITDINTAADKLESARALVGDARWNCSPEADRVSGNLADQAAKMSDNARVSAIQHQETLREIANGLQSQLTAYRQAEQANSLGERP